MSAYDIYTSFAGGCWDKETVHNKIKEGKHYIILYLVTISSLILVGSIQIFSELEEYEDLQIYGVFAVMACCTFVVVTLMQIVVLSQNAYIKKLNDMYSDGKDC